MATIKHRINLRKLNKLNELRLSRLLVMTAKKNLRKYTNETTEEC